MITLKQYAKEHGVSLSKLARILDLSYSYVWRIREDENHQASIETIKKVYEKTKEYFGEGLTIQEWQHTEKFWEK